MGSFDHLWVVIKDVDALILWSAGLILCSKEFFEVTCECINHWCWFESVQMVTKDHVSVNLTKAVGLCTCLR